MEGRLSFTRWEKVGVDGGFCWSCVWWTVGACLSAFCGHSLLASLRMLELCFQVRIVCWPLLGSLETVSSVSVWGIEYCFGFLCLENRSVVVLCYNGLLSFYFIYKLRFCLEIGIGGRTGGGRGPAICGASEVGAAMGLI